MMTTSREGDKLQLIHDAIDQQSKRINELSKISGTAIEISSQTKVEIALACEQIKHLVANVERLNDKIDKGNGFSTRIARIETGLVNLSQGLGECSRRSTGRWKILFGLGTTILAGLVVWFVSYVLG